MTPTAGYSPSGGVCLIGFKEKFVGKCWVDKKYDVGTNLAEGTNCKKEDIKFGIEAPAQGATVDAAGVVTFGDEGAEITVTVKCGDVSDSMKLIYLKIATETFAQVPNDKKRKKLGVCEEDIVTATPEIGAVKWEIQGNGTLSTTDGFRTIYEAPDRASNQEIIKATLTTTDNKTITCSVTFSIVEPSGINLKKTSPDWHKQGKLSAGFCADVRILPLDVCFYNIQVREKEGDIVSDGYFAPLNGKKEPVNETWFGVNEGTNEFPSLKVGGDKVATQGNNIGNTAGNLTATIPLYFRRIFKAEKKYGDAIHIAKSEADGTLLTKKEGAEATAALNAPSVDLGCCGNP